MVEVEEIVEEEEVLSPSQERLLDAEEIEKAASTLTRPTARMQLESVAKKLRKEGEALKRVEASRAAAPPKEEKKTLPAAEETKPAAPPKTTIPASPPVVIINNNAHFVPIDKFSFDDGGYSGAWVTLYIDLPGVGSTVDKENITCQFTPNSFDLIVKGYKGKSYRLYKDNLENEIDDFKSKRVVKADKILVKLAKKKTDYGSFEHWSSLTAKRKKPGSKEKDPSAGIMGLMKEMYDSGDDKMKKVIGETMMKQREGKLGDGMGGMGGGLGDMDI
ncbi:Calcyclin-binding protein [Seminavis robusta]|uniref:Calcyclin-binding protein n=1 Tax=Seminavis robusta TaxID=568900 RepID=A0A9N8HIK4_9STRA|nr:Calcyclin-binding protein [Seminavis robusta]|eukprot:Sro702_g190030.1 Calcyclin-binding protein (275) ;mRNA; r:48066-48984